MTDLIEKIEQNLLSENDSNDIVLRCAYRCVVDKSDRKKLQDFVGKIYGFDYDSHFRRMLIQMVGIIEVKRIENKLDQSKFLKLKSALSHLKPHRNSNAHTHVRGATKAIDAPSVTLNNFLIVYEGLKNFDDVIRASKF